MRAVVFEDKEKLVYKEDYPNPEIGPNDALIKVHYCAICGSDISNYRHKLYQTPLVIGHEFSGEIVEIGENIEGFKIGDEATGVNIVGEKGYGEVKAIGITADGAFAEYVKVEKKFLFHAPKNTPLIQTALLESFAVAVRAVKLSKIQDNENVIVIGGGNIGLTTLSVLLCEKNPNYVLIVEPHEFAREKAIELGATDALPPVRGKLRRFLKAHGEASYIFECAANVNALNDAIYLIKKGGTIVLESVYHGNISIPIFMINSKEITLQGIVSHQREDILKAIELFETQKVKPDKFISEIIPLKDIQKAFDKYLEPGERKFIKIVMEIN